MWLAWDTFGLTAWRPLLVKKVKLTKGLNSHRVVKVKFNQTHSLALPTKIPPSVIVEEFLGKLHKIALFQNYVCWSMESESFQKWTKTKITAVSSNTYKPQDCNLNHVARASAGVSLYMELSGTWPFSAVRYDNSWMSLFRHRTFSGN